jgi:hypothetical protein
MKRLFVLGAACLLTACDNGASDSAKPRIGATPGVAGSRPHPPSVAGAPGIVNGDFEQTAADGSIPGWLQTQHAGEKSYEMRIDAEGAYQGHSFHMIRTHAQVYGTLTQNVDVSAYAGKTVELSAMLKSRGVGPDGWKLLVNGNLAGTLEYSPGVTGTTDWQRQSVKLKLPAGARRLTAGVTLLDAGEGWADNIELKVLD